MHTLDTLCPPAIVAQHRSQPFGDWLDGFVAHLLSREFKPQTVCNYLRRLAAIGDYLRAHGLSVESLTDEATMDSYVAVWRVRYLDRNGREPQHSSRLAVRRSVRELVAYARFARFLPPKVKPGPSILDKYLDYCNTHRGLSDSTLYSHREYLLKLAAFCQARGVETLPNMPLSLLDDFVAHMGQKLSRLTLQGMVGVLRAYLRYLFLMGEEPQDRSALLESPTTFSEMKLPRHLSDAQLDEVLRHVDRSTRSGRRDWAVLILLSVYGLRIGEVARLRIDDLNFEVGQVQVHRVKGGGTQTLPMTLAVREALRDYLEKARPGSAHPEVFLTFRPPARPYRSGYMLSGVCVRKHLMRCELPAYGAHALRHTTARRLRQAGAPLGVLRRILGHASTETTNRYLRIAFEELREVADNYAELL